MRVFVAVPISEEVRKQVAAMIDDLRKSGADCKWVESQNIHLTLAFLGEQQEEALPKIEKVLERVSARAPFPMSFGGTGTFDSQGGPKIVWAGLTEGGKELSALGEAAAAALRQAGFPVEERPFHAHLTLGRLRSQKNVLKLMDRLKHWKTAPPTASCLADRIVIFESQLSEVGPTYQALHERALHA